MKKATTTLLFILFFTFPKAQITEFLSLGYAYTKKDPEGTLLPVKAWIVQKTRIDFDLTLKNVRIFSKDAFDRDSLGLKKEIALLREITYPHAADGGMIRQWSGTDGLGRRCTVRLKFNKDASKTQDGELRIDYPEGVEIYILKNFTRQPTFNRS